MHLHPFTCRTRQVSLHQGSRCLNASGGEEQCYSQGVRRRVFEQLHGRPGYKYKGHTLHTGY